MKILDNLGSAFDDLSNKGSKWTSVALSVVIFYLSLRSFGSNILSNSLGIVGGGYQLLPYATVDLTFMLFDKTKTLVVEGQAFLIAALISVSQMILPPLIKNELKSTGNKWCPTFKDAGVDREIPLHFVVIYALSFSTKNKIVNHVRANVNGVAVLYAFIWILMAYMDVEASVSYLTSRGGGSMLWAYATTIAVNIFLAELFLIMSFTVILASFGEAWQVVKSVWKSVPPKTKKGKDNDSGQSKETGSARSQGGGGRGLDARDSLGTPVRASSGDRGSGLDPSSIFSPRRAD